LEAVGVRSTAILIVAVTIGVASGVAELGFAELNDKLSPSLDHPAIEYFNYLKHPAQDAVANLKRNIEAGKIQLKFDHDKGYLPAVLEALNVPIETQMAVFSKTSFQAGRIEPGNPRTIFFNDAVSLAWVHGGFIELAAQDPKQGVIFYTLEQQFVPQPNFNRRDDCLRCHRSDISLGVPGMILRSFYTMPDGNPKLILGGYTTDHRSPFKERWGGWYVTGTMGAGRHMGNAILTDPDHPESMVSDAPQHVTSLQDKFDTKAYLSPHSDIVALLVFDHQMYMTNLITRVGWEIRCALYDKAPSRALAALLHESAQELVDYLLFIDEAPLPGPVRGTSGFAEQFAARGPRDSHGRSLRQLDLRTRLLRYPCSYMIYSQAFDGLPEQARSAIYERMWQVLSGAEKGTRYSRFSLTDRQAIVDMLRETKPGLPSYFQRVDR
jgi:hypothetical protein